MKKVWIIVLVLIIVLGAGIFSVWKFWPVDYEFIQYGKGLYRVSGTTGFYDLTAAQVEEKFFQPIIFSGEKYKGREIWISDMTGTQWENAGHTVIFLKQKGDDLFDSYSLQGGP